MVMSYHSVNHDKVAIAVLPHSYVYISPRDVSYVYTYMGRPCVHGTAFCTI